MEGKHYWTRSPLGLYYTRWTQKLHIYLFHKFHSDGVDNKKYVIGLKQWFYWYFKIILNRLQWHVALAILVELQLLTDRRTEDRVDGRTHDDGK